MLVGQDNTTDFGKMFETKCTWRVHAILECMCLTKLLAQQGVHQEAGTLRLEQPPLMAKECGREHRIRSSLRLIAMPARREAVDVLVARERIRSSGIGIWRSWGSRG